MFGSYLIPELGVIACGVFATAYCHRKVAGLIPELDVFTLGDFCGWILQSKSCLFDLQARILVVRYGDRKVAGLISKIVIFEFVCFCASFGKGKVASWFDARAGSFCIWIFLQFDSRTRRYSR